MKIAVLDRLTLGEDLDLTPAKQYGELIIYDNTMPDEVEAHIADADVVGVFVALHHGNFENVIVHGNVVGVSAVGCDDYVSSVTDYGAILTASAENGCVYGVQFHPEKSGNVGLNILRAVLEIGRE